MTQWRTYFRRNKEQAAPFLTLRFKTIFYQRISLPLTLSGQLGHILQMPLWNLESNSWDGSMTPYFFCNKFAKAN